MTDISLKDTVGKKDARARLLKKRYAREKRLRFFGLAAIASALLFLLFLFATIFYQGWGAFFQTQIRLEVTLDPSRIDPQGTGSYDSLVRGDYGGLIKKALKQRFGKIRKRSERRQLYQLIGSAGADTLRRLVMADPNLVGQKVSIWLPASDDVDQYFKGYVDPELKEDERRLSDRQIAWVEDLRQNGDIRKVFNKIFFTAGDSREPEQAGILGAVLGSFYTLAVTLAISFPLGVMAAVYLEEFAPKNRISDIIEVNINNLAAVPSIVFGLLGLAIFLDLFGLPRSAPLVGGLVLALMTLPTIIISSRAALKAVPPSIREAALGIGASRVQVVTHHVLPLALPGMMTGTIIGLAQALGETAPLLMIGMVAFIVDLPGGIMDPATVLPVQIYLWADSPERAFVEKTSAAIMVLLAFLIVMNLLAVLLRRKFERRW